MLKQVQHDEHQNGDELLFHHTSGAAPNHSRLRQKRKLGRVING